MIEDMIRLDSPIADLKGFGPKSAEKFTKLDLHTVGDLLLYFPFRYEDFKSKSIFELMDGEKAVITGTVVTPANVQYYGFKRNRLSFKIKQGEAVIAISFFNQPYLVDKIEMGAEVAIFGKWDQKKSAVTGMKVLAQVEDDMQPVYHVAQGVSQAQLIKAIKAAFDSGALEFVGGESPTGAVWTSIVSWDVKRLCVPCIFRKIWLNISRLCVGPSLRSSFISR